jgi:hypothetical protein
MKLEIDQEKITAVIQEHLDRAVKDGIDYRIKQQINEVIAEAITPEVVRHYATAAVAAMTDPKVTERMVAELQRAVAEGVRMTMEEAIVTVACRLRGYQPNRSSEDQVKMEQMRDRLFPRDISCPPVGEKGEP